MILKRFKNHVQTPLMRWVIKILQTLSLSLDITKSYNMNTRKNLNLTLKIWRQKNSKTKGKFEIYKVSDISTDSSFLEMLDILNEQLIAQENEPIAFDHDCRKESAECVLFTLMVALTVQIPELQPVSSI